MGDKKYVRSAVHDKGRANTVIHSKPLQGPAPLQKARRQEGCRFDWKAETFSPASASPATGRPESPHISLFALIPHGRGGDGDVCVRGGGGGGKGEPGTHSHIRPKHICTRTIGKNFKSCLAQQYRNSTHENPSRWLRWLGSRPLYPNIH